MIYTGLFQTPDTVAAAAVDEDVDVIGLSMLSGAHMTLAPLVVEKVRERGADIPVVVGGIVPDADVATLRSLGVAGVLTPGASSDDVVAAVRAAIADAAPTVAGARADGGGAVVDRVERLTNLLALLLETAQPLSLNEIAGELGGQYPANEASAAPGVRAGQGGAARRSACRSRPRRCGGDQAGRPPTGSTATATSCRTSTSIPTRRGPCRWRSPPCARPAAGDRGGRGGAVEARRRAARRRRVPSPPTSPSCPALPVLRDAAARRAPVRFGYHGRTRDVDPYGLLLRNGFWYVLGRDHGYDEQRTYRVDRIEGDVTIAGADGQRSSGPPGSILGRPSPPTPSASGCPTRPATAPRP